PLLEGVDLNGARGVLVNITAGRSLKRREVNEIMNIIESYRAEDATVVFGQAYDETMNDELRVTVVATGLGRARAKPQIVQALRTGTDNAPVAGSAGGPNYHDYDTPAVFRGREASRRVQAMESSGMDHL